jgi:hypothetical protein
VQGNIAVGVGSDELCVGRHQFDKNFNNLRAPASDCNLEGARQQLWSTTFVLLLFIGGKLRHGSVRDVLLRNWRSLRQGLGNHCVIVDCSQVQRSVAKRVDCEKGFQRMSFAR